MKTALPAAIVLLQLSILVSAAEETEGKPILDSRNKTAFRYFEVTATDVARTPDGKLVRVDPIHPRLIRDKESGKWINENTKYFGRPPSSKTERRLRSASHITHGPLPDAGWMKPEFDDRQWARVVAGGRMKGRRGAKKSTFPSDYGAGQMMSKYRSLALMCLRSSFTVSDPVKAGDLRLLLQFRGGVVVYLNGREVGRAHLPEGDIQWDTLADDYPRDVFLDDKGNLLGQYALSASLNYLAPHHYYWRWPKGVGAIVTKRLRDLDLAIPAKHLRKGTNILAIGIHRSAAPEAMFTSSPYSRGRWWNRVSLESMKLLAASKAEQHVVPHVKASRNMTVSSHPVTQDIDHWAIADPNEKVAAVQIQGARNGTYSAMAAVSSASVLKGLKVVKADLKGEGGVIPADRIDVRYQRFDGPAHSGYTITPGNFGTHFGTLDTLESYVPLVLGQKEPVSKKGKRVKTPSFVTQPIWFLVHIPADAKPGCYRGEMRVEAEGQTPVSVPMSVEVLGSWRLPDSKDFRMFVAFDQSPETLAIRYKVPLWSEEHWKLIEESFRLLGALGNKEVLVTFTSKTFVGNEHAMLRFIKASDGTLKADFSIIDRYIQLAAKHMGKIPSVCTIVHYGAGVAADRYGKRSAPQRITVVDPSSKELADDESVPDWGTPQALVFWKPVMEEYVKILKKHGVGPVPVIYWTQFAKVNHKSWHDLKKLVPDLLHMNRSHISTERGRGELGKSRLYNAVVAHNGSGVFWDPDQDKPHYGWRHKLNILSCPREGAMGKNWPGMRNGSYLTQFRLYPEETILNGKGGQFGKHRASKYRAGFGQYGADFWPVSVGGGADKAKKKSILTRRYSSEGSAGYIISQILGAGEKKPCPTGRFQMLLEGLQEAEARMFVSDALLDQPDKLGSDLVKRCSMICDRQTRLLRHFVEFSNYGKLAPQVLRKKSRDLYLLAGEVHQALAGK